MRIIKRVKNSDVKKTFAISQLVRIKKHSGKTDPVRLRKGFIKNLKMAKNKVFKMSEKQIDKIITLDGFLKRLKSYNESQWHVAEFSTSEIGVWRRAGGLPLQWTNDSLKRTGYFVGKAIQGKLKKRKFRAAKVIPSMLRTNIDIFQKEKYLFPIIFKHGTGTNGRKNLKKKVKGDIDDGCMRSIALAVNGSTNIFAYYGIPKK